MRENNTMEPGFVEVARLSAIDADSYLNSLKEKKIKFVAGSDDSGLQNMSAYQASIGGHSGEAVQIVVFVHEKDLDLASSILASQLNIVT